MKRQSSAVSPSSSRRETPPEKLHSKTIGCMSGILHFISNSNARRSHRFLTFGVFRFAFPRAHTISVSFLSWKILVTQYSFLLSLFSGKRQVNKNAAPAAAENSRPENAKTATSDRKLSSEVPRSPTLPAEIRRSNVKPPPAESRREGPALVARLMGLEAAPAPQDSVAQKRQKLLGALQRCDEDLKALKKIIEAVRSTDPPPRSPSPAVASIGLEDKLRTVSEVKCSVVNGEQQQQQQPSPVSVLDEFTRSPLSPSCPSGRHSFGKPPTNLSIHSHCSFIISILNKIIFLILI